MASVDPSPSDLDERTLDAARTGDRRALRRLHDAMAPAVLGYARGQGVEDPEVVANEALFRALRAIEGFDGDSRKFRSWLFTIAHNLIVDDHRRRSRRPVTVELDRSGIWEPTAGPPVAEIVADRLEAEEMVRWIGDLSPHQRSVVLLRLIADLSVADVAKIVGKRQGAVKTLHHRGLAALRRRLDVQGVTHDTNSTFTGVT